MQRGRWCVCTHTAHHETAARQLPQNESARNFGGLTEAIATHFHKLATKLQPGYVRAFY